VTNGLPSDPWALALYALALLGFAFIVGHSAISLPFREALAILGARFAPARWLLKLIECAACISWHVGFWYALAKGARLSTAFVWALISSALALLSSRLAGL
jgi:hypothetical protein